MKTLRYLVAGVLALISGAAFAANVPLLSGAQTIDAPTVNGVIQSINTAVTPQSMAAQSNFRNYVDNGEFQVYQRGTTATAGGTTSGCAGQLDNGTPAP